MIRDHLIVYMTPSDIQRKLLEKDKTFKQIKKSALNWEVGIKQQEAITGAEIVPKSEPIYNVHKKKYNKNQPTKEVIMMKKTMILLQQSHFN